MQTKRVLHYNTLSLLSLRSLVVATVLPNKRLFPVRHKPAVFLRDFIALWKTENAFVISIDAANGLTKKVTGWNSLEHKLKDIVEDLVCFMNSPSCAYVTQINTLPVMSVIHQLRGVTAMSGMALEEKGIRSLRTVGLTSRMFSVCFQNLDPGGRRPPPDPENN